MLESKPPHLAISKVNSFHVGEVVVLMNSVLWTGSSLGCYNGSDEISELTYAVGTRVDYQEWITCAQASKILSLDLLTLNLNFEA